VPMPKQRCALNPKVFVSTLGVGRKTVFFRKGQTIYCQGDGSDALFVIQEGMVRVSVKPKPGKKQPLPYYVVGILWVKIPWPGRLAARGPLVR
jgi:hypothetical protein